MPFDLDQTIAAVASPPGPAPRGIVRVSGSGTVALAASLVDCPLPVSGVPTQVAGCIHAECLGSPLPVQLLLWPGTRSYTGQPMAEFHVIGSPPLLELLMEAVVGAGARLAERGEFTMRAFLNGRIDLLQAEAVLGVIDAADHHELQAALTQLGGGLTRELQQIRSTIIAILGDLEAGLDFVEEDIEFISSQEVDDRLSTAREILSRLLRDSRERLPSGYRQRVVLAGLPNAGKSTLFNCLANANLAIASGIPGTTRDYLTCPITLDGVPVDLIDTAGWDDAAHAVMSSALELRHQQLESADLVVWCTATDLTPAERAQDAELLSQARQQTLRILAVTTCIDRNPAQATAPDLAVSAVTGEGVINLQQAIATALSAIRSSRSELLATTSARCRDSIQRAREGIDQALDSARQGLGDEITAINLRDALHELRAMLGETWTDDILDHIFSSFCIGK